MMSLKSMPVGYRFHPSDQQLVNYYLKYKNQGLDSYVSNIREIEVCKWAPWDLAVHLGSELDDQKEWYFFGHRDPKYVKGNRYNRATKHGFWKPTGKDRNISAGPKKIIIGTKKTLVFHKGSLKKATQWRMHEYCASVDKHNPRAFVLYLLMNKISDEADPNISPPCPELPILDEADPNISPPNYPFDSAYEEDDIDFQLQALQRFFGGQEPTLEELDRLLPAIPVADVYPSQGLTHMTARYLNVPNNDGGVTLFQNIKREVVDNIVSASSILMQTRENVPLDSESGSETVNDVTQSLFGKDDVAVHGGSACHSDMILAHDVSLSANSDVGQRIELDAEGLKKPIILGGRGSAVTNPGTKSLLGKDNHNMGFIAFAENPRVNDGTIPASNYIMNLAIGIFLTVVITGEVLFGLVSQ